MSPTEVIAIVPSIAPAKMPKALVPAVAILLIVVTDTGLLAALVARMPMPPLVTMSKAPRSLLSVTLPLLLNSIPLMPAAGAMLAVRF